jgi:flagellar biosynthesis component FlhA
MFLPTEDARLRFARLLRALVSERVPIVAWPDILAVVRENGLAHHNLTDVVGEVRLKLKAQLPGADAETARITVGEEVEARIDPWIEEQDGKRFFAIPPEDTQALLTDIRELIDGAPDRSVLVTRRPDLRPFIRRLVELEFPDLMVLSEEELAVSDTQPKPNEAAAISSTESDRQSQ